MPVLVPAAVLDDVLALLLAVLLAVASLVAPGAMNMASPVAMSLPFGGAGTVVCAAAFCAAVVEVPLAVGAHAWVDAPATAPIVPALLVLAFAAAALVFVPLLNELLFVVLPVLVLPLAVLLEPLPELLLLLALVELTDPETDTPPEPLLVTPLEIVVPPLPLAVVATEVTPDPELADPPLLLLWQAARPRLRISAPAIGAARYEKWPTGVTLLLVRRRTLARGTVAPRRPRLRPLRASLLARRSGFRKRCATRYWLRSFSLTCAKRKRVTTPTPPTRLPTVVISTQITGAQKGKPAARKPTKSSEAPTMVCETLVAKMT